MPRLRHTVGGRFDIQTSEVMKWLFPIRGNHLNGEWYTNKPDVDNLCKAMYDIMTKLGYWKDDSRIASQVTEKFWAE